MLATATRLTDEQVKLVNEIWFHGERLNGSFDLKATITDEHGETLDEFHLRGVAMRLREEYRGESA